MTEPTPFLHLTILADGRPVHCETVDVRGLAGARALERLVEGHHEVAQRFVAAGHRVQVRLADPDRLAGTAVIDMDASGVTGTQLVDVDPGVEAAWRAGRVAQARHQLEAFSHPARRGWPAPGSQRIPGPRPREASDGRSDHLPEPVPLPVHVLQRTLIVRRGAVAAGRDPHAPAARRDLVRAGDRRRALMPPRHPPFDGERFRRERKAARYTATELAVWLGLTRQTIRNYEAGRSRPDRATVARIARLLCVDERVFRNGSDDEPKGCRMVERIGDEYAARLRMGVAQHDNGQWYVVVNLDGHLYQSPALANEADAVAYKDAVRARLLEGLAGMDGVRVEHRTVDEDCNGSGE
jgi:transcriptional regulator with XRE-family HTH domain